MLSDSSLISFNGRWIPSAPNKKSRPLQKKKKKLDGKIQITQILQVERQD
jgi:hypothetical protein